MASLPWADVTFSQETPSGISNSIISYQKTNQVGTLKILRFIFDYSSGTSNTWKYFKYFCNNYFHSKRLVANIGFP